MRQITRSPRARLAALAVASMFVVAACGGDDDKSAESTKVTTANDDSTAEITIATFQFAIPDSVPAGTVTVANDDDTTHTFTSGTPGAPDGAFDVTLDGPDATETIDVEPGTYEVFCSIHTSMTGTLVVT